MSEKYLNNSSLSEIKQLESAGFHHSYKHDPDNERFDVKYNHIQDQYNLKSIKSLARRINECHKRNPVEVVFPEHWSKPKIEHVNITDPFSDKMAKMLYDEPPEAPKETETPEPDLFFEAGPPSVQKDGLVISVIIFLIILVITLILVNC